MKAPDQISRPNFLIFCVDQMQAAAMSCAGHPDVKTPNLDALAAGGVRFERAYCENPLCTPSRISIFTGLSSRQHGVQTLGCFLPHTTPTVASALHANGYRTRACGKMHVQPWGLERARKAEPGVLPDEMYSWEDCNEWMEGKIKKMPEGYFGFEQTDLVCGHTDYVAEDYLKWLEAEHPRWGRELREHYHKMAFSYYRNEEARVPMGIASAYRMEIPPELHYNNWIADRSIQWMQGLGAEENFFLWCSFPDPHHPFAATKPYSEMYDPAEVTLPENWREHVQRDSDLMPGFPTEAHGIQLDDFDEAGLREMIAQTYGMIRHVDDNIGRVIQALKDSGCYDNTVIAFMSDHGDYLGAHHLVCKGAFPFEEIMNVPFIWSSPESRDGGTGRVETGLSSLLDVAPTMLDYAGVPLEAMQPKPHFTDHPVSPWFDGQSLRTAIDQQKDISAERSLITNKYENKMLSQFGIKEPLTVRCYYKGQHKLVLSSRPGNDCLFDLKTDAQEMTNLWDDPEHRELRNQLIHEYTTEALRTDPIGVGRVSNP